PYLCFCSVFKELHRVTFLKQRQKLSYHISSMGCKYFFEKVLFVFVEKYVRKATTFITISAF
ncbi:hypothetical protein, partial [Fictibacillus arsenicus]